MEEETQEGKLPCLRAFVLMKSEMVVLDFVCMIMFIIFVFNFMCYKKLTVPKYVHSRSASSSSKGWNVVAITERHLTVQISD